MLKYLKRGSERFHAVAPYTPLSWILKVLTQGGRKEGRGREGKGSTEIQAVLPGIPWEALGLNWNYVTSGSKFGVREEMGELPQQALGLSIEPSQS